MPHDPHAQLFKVEHTTTDPNLAACLLAVGVPPVPNNAVSLVTGDSNFVGFNFLPHSEDGKMKFVELVAAWKQENESKCREDDWSYKNPDHPFAYAMATIRNRLSIDQYIRKAVAQVCIQRGSSVAMLDPNGRREVNDQILAKIGA